MIKGQVILSNISLRLFAVRIIGGEISVFVVTDGARMEIGDMLHGNFEKLGLQCIMNETTSQRVEICVEGVYCEYEEVLQYLGKK